MVSHLSKESKKETFSGGFRGQRVQLSRRIAFCEGQLFRRAGFGALLCMPGKYLWAQAF